MRTEDLITQLVADLKPVKRLPSPGRRAAQWLGFAFLVLAGFVLWEGPRHDLMARMATAYEVAQWLASVATGVLAAVAAFQLAMPDRSPRWALLPLPAAILWVASLGWGCFADLARIGPDAVLLGTSWPCLRFIAGVGIPLAATLLWQLRHAGPIRPVPVTVLGGLSAAALCSAGLSLFHHLDAAAMILAWHGGGILVVLGVGYLAGQGWDRVAERVAALP